MSETSVNLPVPVTSTLKSINYLCSRINAFGMYENYHVNLPQHMFEEVLNELAELIYHYQGEGEYIPQKYYKSPYFMYRDPHGYTYKFTSSDLFMITLS